MNTILYNTSSGHNTSNGQNTRTYQHSNNQQNNTITIDYILIEIINTTSRFYPM